MQAHSGTQSKESTEDQAHCPHQVVMALSLLQQDMHATHTGVWCEDTRRVCTSFAQQKDAPGALP